MSPRCALCSIALSVSVCVCRSLTGLLCASHHVQLRRAAPKGDDDDEPDAKRQKTEADDIDIWLPFSNVKRLCKAKLDALAGANVKCEKEAYQTVARVATVFVSYLTACAQEYTKAAKRATIGTSELMDGIVEIDFEPFAAILKLYMANYGDAKEKEKGQPKKKRKTSAFLLYSAALREELKNKVQIVFKTHT